MAKIKFHPLADLFPLLEGSAFQELVADIRANGLREPIVIHEDSILDGRNRYRACVEAGLVDPAAGPWRSKHLLHDEFREFGSEDGETDPLAFVVSLNLHRRHLNESQRSMVAGRIATMRQGERTDLAPIDAKSKSDAARMLNVGTKSVERAKAVLKEAADESKPEKHRKAAESLARMVDSGQVAVSAAERACRLSPDEFLEAVSAGPETVREAAKKTLRPSDRIAVKDFEDWPNSKAHYAAARAIEALSDISITPEEFVTTMHEMVRRRFNNTATVARWLAKTAELLDEEKRTAA